MKSKQAQCFDGSLDTPLFTQVILKFLIIGDYGVGKTAIVRRYAEGKFATNYKITIGAEFSLKSCLWNSTTQVNIQLWDIAGHERFGYMTRVYYKYASAAAIVFDVSRIQTFYSVKTWLEDVRNKVILADGTRIPIIILANKSDIESGNVPTDELDRLSEEEDVLGWFPTSAKNNLNIDAAMEKLIGYVLENRQPLQEDEDKIILKEGSEKLQAIKGCCS